MRAGVTMFGIATATRRTMEHRWGARVSLDAPVLLQNGSDPVGTGNVINASISGALIRTDCILNAGRRLDVILAGVSLAAHVIRRSEGATAVEWCDTLPVIIRSMITSQSSPLLAHQDTLG